MATDAPVSDRTALLQFAREMHSDREGDELLDSEDLSLYELTTLPGWKILKDLIESRKVALKPHFNIEGNDDEFFKSYGMRSVIYDIVTSQLDDLVERVENAREIVKSNRREARRD